MLDPAAGNLEFLRHVPALEKWGVDMQTPKEEDIQATSVKFVQSDIFNANLPAAHFDLIFMSNFLEHLASPESIAELFYKMYAALKPGGRMAIMGPNFRHCAREYFDCSDHRVILTEVSVCELLYSTKFELEQAHARFLPYSFRGKLPASGAMARLYLRMPWIWRLFGKQFLIIARKPLS